MGSRCNRNTIRAVIIKGITEWPTLITHIISLPLQTIIISLRGWHRCNYGIICTHIKSHAGGATVLNLWWRRGGRHPQTKRNVNSIVVTFNEAIANEWIGIVTTDCGGEWQWVLNSGAVADGVCRMGRTCGIWVQARYKYSNRRRRTYSAKWKCRALYFRERLFGQLILHANLLRIPSFGMSSAGGYLSIMDSMGEYCSG